MLFLKKIAIVLPSFPYKKKFLKSRSKLIEGAPLTFYKFLWSRIIFAFFSSGQGFLIRSRKSFTASLVWARSQLPLHYSIFFKTCNIKLSICRHKLFRSVPTLSSHHCVANLQRHSERN